MARKVVLVTDPGIDGAFAVALALLDPAIDVLGLAATAGNVDAEQATKNVQILIEQIDPPRWPRLGAALPVEYEVDASRKVLCSPTDLLELPRPESRPSRFLRQIVPFGIGATSNIYGIEGFHLK